MSNPITIRIDRTEGSLQRLIGLIERRGFHIDRMNMTDGGADREVHLTVRARDASRCVNVLGRQIDRLIGVSCVGAAPAPANTEREGVPCPA